MYQEGAISLAVSTKKKKKEMILLLLSDFIQSRVIFKIYLMCISYLSSSSNTSSEYHWLYIFFQTYMAYYIWYILLKLQ